MIELKTIIEKNLRIAEKKCQLLRRQKNKSPDIENKIHNELLFINATRWALNEEDMRIDIIQQIMYVKKESKQFQLNLEKLNDKDLVLTWKNIIKKYG